MATTTCQFRQAKGPPYDVLHSFSFVSLSYFYVVTIRNEIIAKFIRFQGCFRNCYVVNFRRGSFLQLLIKLILWRLSIRNLALPGPDQPFANSRKSFSKAGNAAFALKTTPQDTGIAGISSNFMDF